MPPRIDTSTLKISDDIRNAAIANQLSIVELRQMTGYSHRKLRQWFLHIGAAVPKRGVRTGTVREASQKTKDMVALQDAGWSLRRIGGKYAMSHQAVDCAIQRYRKNLLAVAKKSEDSNATENWKVLS